jgi:hypothetical protein
VADTFHQATVAQEDVGVVVNHRVTFAVELGGQQLLGQRHADRIGDALTQRSGRGFHAGGDTHFGVTGSLAVQCAEVFQLGHGQLVTGEVQQRIDQHGTVSVGQHKAVTIQPVRVGRVMAQVLSPQRHSHIGHAHGRTRMTGIGGLDSVHCKSANGTCHLLGVLRAGHGLGDSG